MLPPYRRQKQLDNLGQDFGSNFPSARVTKWSLCLVTDEYSVITKFPPISEADEHGLLAIGGDLEVGSLLLAYRSGIFPWPFNKNFLAWFSPPQRAVLFLDEFHVSRSLKKDLKKSEFIITIDQAFPEVIQRCAEMKNRKDQTGTWITDEMIEGYIEFHRAGYAHSVETWLDGKLVGGHYGVSIGKFYAAESMFYRAPNASKAGLVFIAEYLQERGISWIDFQALNPFTESIGAREIERAEFIKLLKVAVKSRKKLFPC